MAGPRKNHDAQVFTNRHRTVCGNLVGKSLQIEGLIATRTMLAYHDLVISVTRIPASHHADTIPHECGVEARLLGFQPLWFVTLSNLHQFDKSGRPHTRLLRYCRVSCLMWRHRDELSIRGKLAFHRMET